jgi:hypothetical protein
MQVLFFVLNQYYEQENICLNPYFAEHFWYPSPTTTTVKKGRKCGSHSKLKKETSGKREVGEDTATIIRWANRVCQ